jgi:recombination protein RecT
MEPQTNTTTALTLRQRIDSDRFKAEIARALPKHLTPDRFVRIAATAIMRTPLLEKCDQVSVVNAMMTLGQLGIEADGRRAHLIPFFNSKRNCYECQLIIDYKGLAELVMRSGIVSYLHADTVCENDQFLYNKGQIDRHIIDYKQPRGAVYCVYAICRFKDGCEKAEVMSTEEVEQTRKRSKAANAGPWVTDWSEMSKKAVFRRLSKWLPLSPEFRDAVEADSDAIDITSERVDMPTAFAPPPPPPRISDSERIVESGRTFPAEWGGVEQPVVQPPVQPPEPAGLPVAPAKRGPGRPRTKVEPVAPKEPIAPAQEAEPGEPTVQPEEPPATAPEEAAGEIMTPQQSLKALLGTLERANAAAGEIMTPQQSLANQVMEAGFSWDELVDWNAEMNFIELDLSTLPGFDDLPTTQAMKLLGSIVGLLKQLKARKAQKGAK